MERHSVEKHHNIALSDEAKHEPMSGAKACPRCGGTKFEAGQLKIPHSGDVIFRLFKTSLTQRSPNIPITAEICLSCGALEFTADPEKARELLK